LQPRKIALLARHAAEDKKAEDILVLDISKLTSIAHYFVIAHGNSDRQVQAIAQHVIDTFKKSKISLLHVEGIREGRWILIDAGSVMVHVFYRETREYYGLERLWGEAPAVK